MKNKLPAILLIAQLLACTIFGESMTAGPGETIVVSKIESQPIDGARNWAELRDARDVVKALNILLRFAPDTKYEGTSLVYASSASAVGFTSYTARKTEAESLREKAKDLTSRAEQLEKDQADIKWARGVLEKWQARIDAMVGK